MKLQGLYRYFSITGNALQRCRRLQLYFVLDDVNARFEMRRIKRQGSMIDRYRKILFIAVAVVGEVASYAKMKEMSSGKINK